RASSPLFPYTTLFRSLMRGPVAVLGEERDELAAEAGGGRVADHCAEDAASLAAGADARHERRLPAGELRMRGRQRIEERVEVEQDRKSTRLNSSHLGI